MSAKVAVYSVNAKNRNERPLFFLTRREAEEMLGASARNVSPKRNKLTHIQFRDVQRDEKPSPCCLTMGEMESNVGLRGSAGWIQQVQEKITAWPEIGDNLAVRVRPRMA